MKRMLGLRSAALLALVLIAPTRPSGGDDVAKGNPDTFRVVGYLPEYRASGFDPAAAADLDELVYFSVEVEPTGKLDLARLKPEALRALRAAKARHGVALTLCVGGWNRSAGFAPMAASPGARRRFVGELARFCVDNGFDGVDLDWEHPKTPAEAEDHASLLAAAREAFGPRRLALTIAVAGWQDLSPRAIGAVDAVNLMAYDADGRHSTFDFARADVDRVARRGVPLRKIRLGVPFYGRGVADRSIERSYAEIVAKDHPAPEVDEVGGVYFNGPRTIERKTRYALDAKLGGIMIWEVGQDTRDDRSLLKAIRRTTGPKARLSP